MSGTYFTTGSATSGTNVYSINGSKHHKDILMVPPSEHDPPQTLGAASFCV